MKNKKILQVFIQIAIVTTILLLPYLLNIGSIEDAKKMFLNPLAFRYFISFTLLISFTYFYYLWLVLKIYLNRQFLLYVLTIGVSLLTVLYLPEGIAHAFKIDDKIGGELGFSPKDAKPNELNTSSGDENHY